MNSWNFDNRLKSLAFKNINACYINIVLSFQRSAKVVSIYINLFFFITIVCQALIIF